jgi:hypothetical protein
MDLVGVQIDIFRNLFDRNLPFLGDERSYGKAKNDHELNDYCAFHMLSSFAGEVSHHLFFCNGKPVQLTPTRKKAKGG